MSCPRSRISISTLAKMPSNLAHKYPLLFTQGYNCCIFAYGQTGAGKTYSILGDTHKLATDFYCANRGILPRLLADIYGYCQTEADRYCIRCSYMEIYNEQIFDLVTNKVMRSFMGRRSWIISERISKRGYLLKDCPKKMPPTTKKQWRSWWRVLKIVKYHAPPWTAKVPDHTPYSPSMSKQNLRKPIHWKWGDLKFMLLT